MKKYIAAALIAAAVLSLASCGWRLPGSSGPSESPEPSAAPSETPEASPSPEKTAVDELLGTEPAAGELGQYVMQNARDLPAEENDKLLERLLLVQPDVTISMSTKILNNAYMSALDDTMGGLLDPTKIPNIKDQAVRADYQALFDSLMTVVRYEESPIIETNWSALNKLKTSFGEQTAFIIEYSARLQGNYYGDELRGPDLMAADIAAIEKEFLKASDGFVRWQLRGLYAREVATLLYGPEGAYISDFTAGKKEVHGRLNTYAAAYPDTKFGRTCASLLNMTSESQQAVTDAINGSIVFPPDDPRTIEFAALDEKSAALTVPEIVDKDNSALAQQLNKTVRDAAAGMLPAGTKNQQLYSSAAVCGNYLSVALSCSYAEKSGKPGYRQQHLVFDLTTGSPVTLDDLAAKPLDAYKAALLQVMRGDNVPADLAAPVDFALNSGGMTIYVSPKSGTVPDEYNVTMNGLRSFMDISKLY
ncbi:hypothetical protein SAMN02745823_03441 [Sporobacter termitidis DSM 10068]|uniref:Uncharacterized protein n=1 Tax=Sporobacter termitidis DSM 10068 TaxID=1123282 RepID=A0A1M5Z9Z8_9FIRM|nr:hypothetical protein [Sporobacter termitidis]SHI21047.1 hypothetical protein SAMN02745823_03441 [Sporobacter termitidis DSM 10068]